MDKFYIGLKYLLLGSSLFSRKLKLCIEIKCNKPYIDRNIAAIRELSDFDVPFLAPASKYYFELDPSLESTAQPFCDKLRLMTGFDINMYCDYRQYRLR